MAQQDKNNLLYLYDLPETATSIKIAQLLKNQCDYDLQQPAQFIRDVTKPFPNAILRISDPSKLDQCSEKLRYFELDGKQCRALKFDRDLLGANRQKLNDNSVFVRGIPKDMTAAQLHQEFSQFGEIKSLKISLNPDHTSRQYGFICFSTVEAAQKALETFKDGQKYQVIRYQPKDKRDMRRAFNNIYVKNFPPEWSEEQLKQEFEQYGNIKSLVRYVHPENGQPFAFICFEDPEGKDKEMGPKCAMNAVKELNGKKLDENHTLYVKEALKKAERAIEKKKEMLRYKNSKKRCNLYVKNFPPETTKEQLEQLFGQYGTIESIKIFTEKDSNNAVYAFVCFEKPEAAFEAKQALNQFNLGGKQLYINHYEIKEIRQIQVQDIKDKADFQKQKKTSINMDQITSRPEILQLLEHLLTLIQPKLQNMYGQGRMRRPMNRGAPGAMPQPGVPRPGQRPMQQPMGQPMMPQRPMNMPPMPMGQVPPMGPQGAFPMANPMMQRMVPQQMNMQQQYAQRCMPIVSAVDRNNPNYKTQVGEAIYEFVERIANEDVAPKITGMLIDLPIEDIIVYLQNYNALEEKVRQAHALLTEQSHQ